MKIVYLLLLSFFISCSNNNSKSDKSTNEETISKSSLNLNNASTIRTGEIFEGGIIVCTDSSGEHGLICGFKNLNGPVVDYDPDLPNWSEAQLLCSQNRSGGFKDWRLPTKTELLLIFKYLVKSKPQGIEKTPYSDFQGYSAAFWSAEEHGKDSAWIFFQNTSTNTDFEVTAKSMRALYTRAVRTF